MKVRVHVVGTLPLLCHNEQLANPLNPVVRQIKALTGKRKKTEDDLQSIAFLEFQGGFYYDADRRPCIPGRNLWTAIRNAARGSKDGQLIEKGCIVTTSLAPIEYDGPIDPKEMADQGFMYVCLVGIQRSRVLRSRPRFDNWEATFEFEVLDDVLDLAAFAAYVDTAGRLHGVGDGRPHFGRFTATTEEI